MRCIDLQDYKLDVRLNPELSIDNAIGYASVLNHSSMRCRTKAKTHPMCTAPLRTTVNKYMPLFYDGSPLALPFNLG